MIFGPTVPSSPLGTHESLLVWEVGAAFATSRQLAPFSLGSYLERFIPILGSSDTKLSQFVFCDCVLTLFFTLQVSFALVERKCLT